MERYVQPISTIIAVNDTEYLPIGGGGLAKQNTIFENDSLIIKHKDLWD